jgi:NADPH-dependent 2,4-dienoyl-CoA reductase/sulfur reductase-like enzyme/rhodanese-related sulfurtransferase
MVARRSIVVVGGSVAGTTAAVRARELDGDARIVLLDCAEDAGRFVRGLPYWVSGEAASLEAIRRRRADTFWDLHRIEVRSGPPVTGLDASARRVRAGSEAYEFTALVYAAEALPAVPPALAGAGEVLTLRTAEDLRPATEAAGAPGRRVVVVGGGPEAVEAADAFARARHQVVLLTEELLLEDFSVTAARLATEGLRAAGIDVRARTGVAAFARASPATRLTLTDGTTLDTDLVIVAAAPRPDTDILRQAGAELNADDSVSVDEAGATLLPHVFACGACVSAPHAVSGWPVWPLPPSAAEKTAIVAGTSAAGGHARLAPVLGSMVVRAGSLVLARTGLTHEETQAFAGPDAGSVTVHGSSCERFLSASQPLSLELLYHSASGLILGAEAWGRDGADKRIDVVALALLGGLTVDQLALADLAYAPTLGTVRDVVNVAGRVAASAREGRARPWKAADLAAALGRVVIVDVEPERGRVGDILDSIVMPLPDLRDRLRSLPRDRPIVFVSLTGRLAYLAARVAHQAGLRDAGYLSGGMLSWTAAGLPVKQAGESR